MKKILVATLLYFIGHVAIAQSKNVTRIARVTIDSVQLDDYRVLLKEQMETAIAKEQGVISYSVYADKTAPYKLTIIEVYAGIDAYLAHRETPHFKKYKEATKNMVKSLELSEVTTVFSAGK